MDVRICNVYTYLRVSKPTVVRYVAIKFGIKTILWKYIIKFNYYQNKDAIHNEGSLKEF